MAERKTITDATCKNAKPAAMRYEVADSTRNGFRLSVQPSGSKSLILRYWHDDKSKNMILAPYTSGANSLSIALEAYRKAQDALARGEDPKAILRPQHDDDATVTAHVARYKKAKAPDWSEATAYLAGLELERLIDAIGAKAIGDVTRKDVQKVIDESADRGPHAQVACWKWVRAFFAWCHGRDDIPADPAVKIERPRPDTMRDRVLDDREIRVVWRAAVEAGGAPGRLVRLLVLTGCRRDEIAYLKWSEVGDTEITIPGRGIDRKTKNRVTHRIPITPAIKAVLAECPRIIEGRSEDDPPRNAKFVVTGADRGLGGHTKAKAAVDAEIAKVLPDIEAWHFHDLRRTMATGLAKRGIPIPVTEKCLNQSSGEHAKPLVKIYQHFDHADAVKKAFQLWSRHVSTLVADKRKLAA